MRNHSSQEPLHLPPRTRRPLLDFGLPIGALASGIMLLLATLAIFDATSWLDYVKAITLAFGGMAASFGINTLAVERGAPQAATGYFASAVASVISMAAVGFGLFCATYAGLTLKDTAELQLQEHGQALSGYIATVNADAARAARVNPVVKAISNDLADKAACEIATSCVSGRGAGGVGPVARVLQEYSGRAATIADQIVSGAGARSDILSRLNADLTQYENVLAQDIDVWKRRSDLQVIDARIRQITADLQEAAPLALLSAYAVELQSGASIEDRPEAEARLRSILQRHGQTLASVLGTIERSPLVAPIFPRRTGVSDTLTYALHFLPIASIAAVVELVFPMVLWIYTLCAIRWDKHKARSARDAELASSPARIAHATKPAMQALASTPRRGRRPSVPNGHDRDTHPIGKEH